MKWEQRANEVDEFAQMMEPSFIRKRSVSQSRLIPLEIKSRVLRLKCSQTGFSLMLRSFEWKFLKEAVFFLNMLKSLTLATPTIYDFTAMGMKLAQ
jgi:hypothetical protein